MERIIVRREIPPVDFSGGLHPLLSRLYSARGVKTTEELERGLDKLAPFHLLANIDQAVACLLRAFYERQHIMVIGDFDTDGATSTALAVKCLQGLGAEKVSYLVPNRFKYGYGLTPEIVEVAATSQPQLLLTVDNGISSHEGVQRAKELHIGILITDHHLPPALLPPADAMVNPNLPDDNFPSKNLAGVGVIFYVLMALRARLREEKWFIKRAIAEPNMAAFLDLVALGTVADVVTLDKNNRILVHQGLLRIKAGKVRPGIKALLDVAGRKMEQVTAADLGYVVAPRLNAAGRLVDMRLGIECLLADDEKLAKEYATQLDFLNKERQQIEEGMREQAIGHIQNLQLNDHLPVGVCLFDETWHQGIIGILASRVKELVHRPVIAFALANEEELKGSGRSIQGLHLKEVLERIALLYPGLITKFGGHAMAAGMSLARKNYAHFVEVFNTIVSGLLSEDQLRGVIYSDGELNKQAISLETADLLHKAGPWGQGFPEPLFDGQFKIIHHQILKEKHIKFLLKSLEDYFTVEAVAFNVNAKKMILQGDEKLHVAYRLNVNEYKETRNVQLLIDYFEVIHPTA
jgi:single-stranded-DNA-specific exonuclease